MLRQWAHASGLWWRSPRLAGLGFLSEGVESCFQGHNWMTLSFLNSSFVCCWRGKCRGQNPSLWPDTASTLSYWLRTLSLHTRAWVLGSVGGAVPLPPWEMMKPITDAVLTGRTIKERRNSPGLGSKNKEWCKKNSLLVGRFWNFPPSSTPVIWKHLDTANCLGYLSPSSPARMDLVEVDGRVPAGLTHGAVDTELQLWGLAPICFLGTQVGHIAVYLILPFSERSYIP